MKSLLARKDIFNFSMYRYVSSCVYEKGTYTCYDSLPNTGNRKLPRWTPCELVMDAALVQYTCMLEVPQCGV